MTATNPPQERETKISDGDPLTAWQNACLAQLLRIAEQLQLDESQRRRASLLRRYIGPLDEIEDDESDDGSRVPVSRAELERRRTEYQSFLAMRRPVLPRVVMRRDMGRER